MLTDVGQDTKIMTTSKALQCGQPLLQVDISIKRCHEPFTYWHDSCDRSLRALLTVDFISRAF